jgi:oligopeptide transport system substrate-binding protein
MPTHRPVAWLFPALLGLALATGLWFAGCARRETPVEAGIRTQTLLVSNFTEPSSLDPHVAYSAMDARILAALFEGLTVLDEQTALPAPGVAETWDVSPDGLVYTFHLRPDAKWSNGDPVTAHDFAFAFRRILHPKLAARNADMFWPIRQAKAFNTGRLADASSVGVEALDAVTLRLTLESPTPWLPALAAHLSWLPVHRATIEQFGALDDRATPWAQPGRLVGNGAFRLTGWRRDVSVVVQKNPHYWDAARNRLERVEFFPIRDSKVEENQFRAGQIHATFLIPFDRIAHYRTEDPGALHEDPNFASGYVSFNVTRPPFDQVKVRRALALAVDREGISRAVYHGSFPSAGHLIPPNCGGYTARARVPTDFAAARRLLAEAGFAAGRGIPTFEILVPDLGSLTGVPEVIQETWRRELGIETTIAKMEAAVAWQNEQALNYSVNVGFWVADFADPMTFFEVFRADGGSNQTGWKNPTYDRLLDDARRALDQARRFEILQQAETLLLQEAPIAPFVFRGQTFLLHSAVKGWDPAPLMVRRFQRVWLER